jgi:hypothetical protein
MIIKLEDIYKELQREDVRQAIKETAIDVTENIQDPKTHATNKRSITIELSMSPNPERTECQLDITVKSKLARRITIPTTLIVGDEQPALPDPNQPSFDDLEDEADED